MSGRKKPPKGRMGRPPKKEGEVRSVVFTIRLTQEEREAIAEAARRSGKRDTEWARDTLLSSVFDTSTEGA